MSRLPQHRSCALAGLVAFALTGGPTVVFAQVTDAADVSTNVPGQGTGDSVGALPGIVRVGVATPLARGAAISAFAGYGFLGDILGLEDSHHRAAGEVSATLRLTEWLGFGVRFDGRYDKHNSSTGSDDGYVGDPRIVARAVRALGGGLAVGGQLNLWLPGSDAPSLVTSAISAEAIFLASYALPTAPVTLSANLGYRLDNSAEAVDDPMALSLADRLALGLSESNAVLAGAGIAYRAGSAELLFEATYEALLGSSAPPASRSPLEAAGGVRLHLASNLQLQAYARARLTSDPVIDSASPLVAVSPKFGAMAGLHFQFGGPKPAAPGPLVVEQDDKVEDKIEKPIEPPKPSDLGGVVRSGGAPISEATVTVTVEGETRTVVTDGDGAYKVDNLPGDKDATVTVEREGFAPSTTTARLGAGKPSMHDVEIDRILAPGNIKGVVRDFRSQPVRAKVTVKPLDVQVEADVDGVFSVDVAPGEYEVIIEAGNYRPQRKQVRVEKGTVTILNIDLQTL